MPRFLRFATLWLHCAIICLGHNLSSHSALHALQSLSPLRLPYDKSSRGLSSWENLRVDLRFDDGLAKLQLFRATATKAIVSLTRSLRVWRCSSESCSRKRRLVFRRGSCPEPTKFLRNAKVRKLHQPLFQHPRSRHADSRGAILTTRAHITIAFQTRDECPNPKPPQQRMESWGICWDKRKQLGNVPLDRSRLPSRPVWPPSVCRHVLLRVIRDVRG